MSDYREFESPTRDHPDLLAWGEERKQAEWKARVAKAKAKHDLDGFFRGKPPHHAFEEISRHYDGNTTLYLKKCIVCGETEMTAEYIGGGGY